MNRDQWNNVFEFVKAFGDFDDHGAYDPDGGIFQNLANFSKNIFSTFQRNQKFRSGNGKFGPKSF